MREDVDMLLLTQKTLIVEYQNAYQMDLLCVTMYSLFVISVLVTTFMIGYLIGKEMWRKDE
jgi:hypothetical protein